MFKFTQPHLSLILRNGSVWDIQFDKDFKRIEKKLQIQLPNSKNYFGFFSKSKVLNFVRDDIGLNIIQWKDGKHMVIPKSSVKFKEQNEYKQFNSYQIQINCNFGSK